MEQLKSEGWRINPEAALEVEDDQDLRSAVLDMDLKSVGEKSLPLVQDKTITRLVLQVDDAQNIGPSSTRGKRILRLKLTDGNSFITAVEYKPVASLNDEIPPGTKVLIKGAKIHSGIVLLDDRSIQVLGGKVPVLYEAWEIQRKYSGSTRPPNSQRPPVFGARHSEAPVASSTADSSASKPDSINSKPEPSTSAERIPRVVVEAHPDAGPASNQTASKKLLEKRADEASRPRRPRFGRGRRDEEDPSALTLDEWEAMKKAGANANLVSDEELARRLQEELDLEDQAPPADAAEQLRQSMFSFNREEAGPRPRGRGRGRGRRR